MDFGAAIIAFVTSIIIKFTVMFIGARLLWRLHGAITPTPSRSTLWLLLPKDNVQEIKLLWWSLAFFFISELTCGIELYIILQSSPVLTGIHSITSGLGMAIFALSLYVYINKRLIKFTEPMCCLNKICRGCTVREGIDCGFRPLLVLIGVFLVLASIAPLFASTDRMMADVKKYILPFQSLNSWYDQSFIPWVQALGGRYYTPSGNAFYFPESMFIIEFRIFPVLALIMSIAGMAATLRSQERLGVKLFSLASGLLAYIYFELILLRATGDAFIGALGHEIGELWFLLFTSEFLRHSFSNHKQGGQDAEVITQGDALPL